MADAPGAPGIPPRWTSSDKSGVGTALQSDSRVWFTLSHGILNECYYPRVDQPCTRDFGFIVTDGYGLFAEEKAHTHTTITALGEGVPGFELTNTHRPDGGAKPRFRIVKRVIADPRRDVILQSVRLERFDTSPLRLHALLAPCLANAVGGNTGWVGDFKGQQMLFADGGGCALALAASTKWRARSAGFIGVSDGWQDLSRHFRLTWEYERAVDGDVALVGEVVLPQDDTVIFALGFGRTPTEAAFRARASLADDFTELAVEYAAAWQDWQASLRPLDRPTPHRGQNTYRVSTAVLRTHEAPSFRGATIASLSIPWAAASGDDDRGGYHLVWPRCLAETGGAWLAAGAHAEARRVLDYFRVTQEPDGHWPQNNWLDGSSYWQGVLMDETALPILLLDLACREAAVTPADRARYWPMVRRAAGFLVRRGPVTGQERWEENAGFSPYTLSLLVPALLIAAEHAGHAGHPAIAAFLTDTADSWYASVDRWTFARDTQLTADLDIDGYYVRNAPCAAPGTDAALDGGVQLRHQPEGQGNFAAHQIVSSAALSLVRFGLRRADDPRILATIRAVDDQTRVDLADGPFWYRYTHDGYGERADGAPFDGTGIGRLWPLLTGERAHLAIAAGALDEARALLATLEASTTSGALIAEQIWDADDIEARDLRRGCPSGSAMPLVWAHAEHIKLLRSLQDGRVFDMPAHARQRYLTETHKPRVTPWRPGFQAARLGEGRVLRIELPCACIVVWSQDNWRTQTHAETEDTGLGVHMANIDCAGRSGEVVFTWRERDTQSWVGADYRVEI